jgi:lipopolysaccharide export system permease protein
MRLLDRYLLRELLVPLGFCLCGFLMLFIFFDLFASLNEFQGKKMVWTDIVEYYVVMTPQMLVIVLPVALLLALLYTTTSLARYNEITAIRAAGVSLWRLCVPYLGVGIVSSLVLFAMNELWVPDSAAAADEIKQSHTPRPPGSPGRNVYQDTGFVNHHEGRMWQFHLYNTQNGEMTKAITVIWKQPDGSQRWLKAERAVPVPGGWKFEEVREYADNPDAGSQLAPLLQTNRITFPFSETLEQVNTTLKLTAGASFLAARKADLSIREIRDYFRLNPDPVASERDNLNTKLQARLATPWTCLVVVLIAIPFGVASGRRNVYVGVASSVLICFIYFILQQFGLIYGMNGRLPAWLAAWLPNLAFSLVALGLAARVR